LFELITGGDYLFDPASGTWYGKDDDHIAQIMELLGEIPKSIAFSRKYSSEFFNRKGELRHINRLRYWPLDAVLHDKYLFPKLDAEALGSFLLPMVRLHPDRRAKASELVHHNWLDGVVREGWEAERDKRKREGEERSRTRSRGRGGVGDLHEANDGLHAHGTGAGVPVIQAPQPGAGAGGAPVLHAPPVPHGAGGLTRSAPQHTKSARWVDGMCVYPLDVVGSLFRFDSWVSGWVAMGVGARAIEETSSRKRRRRRRRLTE
ncbi:hypothetical protein DFP72DRAFT_900082, partial [Ephemerocybe angulata]